MQFKTLGPYRIGEPLGRGGMGEVYRAVHTETEEAAAVKVLNPALASSEGFRERFEAEIDSLRKLEHPNIVRMFGYGEQDGFLFYGMELVEGRNLEDELCAGRRFDWREITSIGIQLSKALKHAHDHGVIHRDLKPANVILTDSGRAKLLDFGIARLFGGTSMTSAGGVLGTADYMSPEQADGRPVTERCDQYSLGGVLYALAAGRPPFRAATLPELLQLQRFADPEPVSRYARDLPVEVERIIMQLLEKDPERRFPNASVLARHMAAMEKALSRPIEPDDFELAADRPVAPANPEPLGETRLSAPQGPGPSDTPARAEAGPAAEGRPDSATLPDPDPDSDVDADVGVGVDADAPRRRAAATAESPGESLAHTTEPNDAAPALSAEPRFTTVEEAREQESLDQRESKFARLAAMGGLVAALIATVGTLWYFMRPPKADELYASITAAAAAESDRSGRMLDAADAMETFGSRFPDDPRSEIVARFREETELIRAERRLRARARLGGTGRGLEQVEQMVVDAIREAEVDPARALARLTALVDLYDEPDAPPRTRQCLLLARRQAAQLGARIETDDARWREALTARLDRANALADDQPERARRMWQAIVELGRDRSAAADIVEQAEQRLEETEAGQDGSVLGRN